MALDQQQIIVVAMDLLAREGRKGLTMRALAAELDIQAPSLYWHFKNKRELEDAISEKFYSVASLEASRLADDWRDWLIHFGHIMRRSLLLHRDSAMLCLKARPSEPWQENAINFIQPLIDRGLNQATAFRRLSPVVSLTLGFVASEQSEGLGSYLAKIFSPDDSYREGLLSMVMGWPDEPLSDGAGSGSPDIRKTGRSKAKAGEAARA